MCAAEAFVSPWGVEPQSSEPESDILSIELREQIEMNAPARQLLDRFRCAGVLSSDCGMQN